jgi:hypothetical protein
MLDMPASKRPPAKPDAVPRSGLGSLTDCCTLQGHLGSVEDTS